MGNGTRLRRGSGIIMVWRCLFGRLDPSDLNLDLRFAWCRDVDFRVLEFAFTIVFIRVIPFLKSAKSD